MRAAKCDEVSRDSGRNRSMHVIGIKTHKLQLYSFRRIEESGSSETVSTQKRTIYVRETTTLLLMSLFRHKW